MGENAIEINNLTKSYKLYASNKRRIIESLFPMAKHQFKEFRALDNVSFTIKKGEIVGIIGKNGSGKSTLLKIISGVLQASEGEVKVDGKISALLELGAGFNPEYTGIENIYLNGTLNKLTKDEVEKRINDIAEFADIGDFIHQPVKNYSSGMFVRLAFAVAVYSNPDILIVDEALAVGDAAFQAKCMARMHQIMQSGATVLFVTHDMNTIKSLCQRCIYLQNGTKLMEGNADEVADVYLRNIRESMNKEHLKLDGESSAGKEITDKKAHDSTPVCGDNHSLSGDSEREQDFIKRTKMFTEGTGEIEFLDLKLVNEDGEETKAFAFDQLMKIIIKFRVNKDFDELTVGYHIRDDKNVELAGSSTRREFGEWFKAKEGEVYLLEAQTKLPFIEGNYNITLVASQPVIENRTALFLGYVEQAAVFSVEENFACKLWDKVYLKNEIKLQKIS